MTIAKLIPTPVADTKHADVLLELSFLMTAVDGRLADEELAAYRVVASKVRGEDVSEADLEALIERFADNIEKGEIEARAKVIAEGLPTDIGELAFKISMGLALVDDDASPDEDDLVGILVKVLGLTSERADALSEEVRSAFGA